MRALYDAADPDAARIITTTGQSGSPVFLRDSTRDHAGTVIGLDTHGGRSGASGTRITEAILREFRRFMADSTTNATPQSER